MKDLERDILFKIKKIHKELEKLLRNIETLEKNYLEDEKNISNNHMHKIYSLIAIILRDTKKTINFINDFLEDTIYEIYKNIRNDTM
jgi:hypothetical protein